MTTIMPETETTITSVVTEETEAPPPTTSGKDPDKRHMINETDNTHIWRPGMKTTEIVDIAMVRRIEIQALCGYRWIPVRGNTGTAGLETCEACIDIAGKILSEG